MILDKNINFSIKFNSESFLEAQKIMYDNGIYWNVNCSQHKNGFNSFNELINEPNIYYKEHEIFWFHKEIIHDYLYIRNHPIAKNIVILDLIRKYKIRRLL